MNSLLTEKYIAVEGKDNALKIAAALIDQNYQVFIQLEDCDIYIVAYTDNDTSCGGSEFALLNDDEQELIRIHRNDKTDSDAIARVKYLIHNGFMSKDELEKQIDNYDDDNYEDYYDNDDYYRDFDDNDDNDDSQE